MAGSYVKGCSMRQSNDLTGSRSRSSLQHADSRARGLRRVKWVSGSLEKEGPDGVAKAPAVERARPVDLLLDAVSRFYAEGAAAAAPAARAANEALLADHALPQETVRWMVLGANLAFETFDDELL